MSADWLSVGVSSIAEGRYLFGICLKTCTSRWNASVFFSCLIFAKCCMLSWDGMGEVCGRALLAKQIFVKGLYIHT